MIGCQLVLITNRKSYIGYGLSIDTEPTSVTLNENDLERLTVGLIAVILRCFTEFDSFASQLGLRHSG